MKTDIKCSWPFHVCDHDAIQFIQFTRGNKIFMTRRCTGHKWESHFLERIGSSIDNIYHLEFGIYAEPEKTQEVSREEYEVWEIMSS